MKTKKNFIYRMLNYKIYEDDWRFNAEGLGINILDVNCGTYISDSNLMDYIKEICSNDYVERVKTYEENAKNNLSESHFLPCKPAIFVEAETGTGKTYFINNDLRQYATKKGMQILYLANRDAVALQQKYELIKYDNSVNEQYKRYGCDNNWLRDYNEPIAGIIVMTYQKFFSFSMSKLKQYNIGFVVSDEAHYYISDSAFVGTTHETLIKIINKFYNIPRIYISATGNEIIPVLSKYEIELYKKGYDVLDQPDIRECYNLLYFGLPKVCKNYRFNRLNYSSNEDIMIKNIIDISNKTKQGEKTIIFVISKAFGKKLKDALGKANANKKNISIAYLDSDDKNSSTYKNIVEKNKFEEDILITTPVLDNGVNIKDCKFNNIIILHLDAIKYVQAMGRKRFMEGELLNVWLTDFNIDYLKNIKVRFEYLLKELDIANKDLTRYVLDGYLSNNKPIIKCIAIIDGKYKINPFVYTYINFSLGFIDKLIGQCENDTDVCIKAQLSLLNAKDHYEHLGYSKAEWALYQRLNELIANKGYYIMRRDELCKFKDMLDEFLGKSNTERPDRDFSCKKATNRLIRHNLPFILEEKGDYIILIKGEIPSEEGESE